MVKMTFTLDDQTVERLRRTAARLAKPQSYVVREAVREYEARSTKLSDEERTRMVAIIDRMLQEPPTRAAGEVDGELQRIRAARRQWARRPALPDAAPSQRRAAPSRRRRR
jgi:predicted transcriptional regulator